MTEKLNYAERAMNVFWDHYEAGDMDRPIRLVRSLGYSALGIDFVFNPDNYYFPNCHDGQLIRPKSIDASKIPVVALQANQAVTLPQPRTVHPLQRVGLVKHGYSETTLDKVESFLSRSPSTISSPGRSEASVHVSLVAITGRQPIKTNAALVLRDADGSPQDKCPSILMHELVHVVQALDSPVTNFDDIAHVDDELEAYGAVAELGRAGVIPHSSSIEMAFIVDVLRSKHLGSNNFKSTSEFLTVIKENPISILE